MICEGYATLVLVVVLVVHTFFSTVIAESTKKVVYSSLPKSDKCTAIKVWLSEQCTNCLIIHLCIHMPPKFDMHYCLNNAQIVSSYIYVYTCLPNLTCIIQFMKVYYKIIMNFLDISLSKCISDIRQLSIVTTRGFCHFTTSLSIENTCKLFDAHTVSSPSPTML